MDSDQSTISKRSREWFKPWRFLSKKHRKGTPPNRRAQDEAPAVNPAGEVARTGWGAQKQSSSRRGPNETRIQLRIPTVGGQPAPQSAPLRGQPDAAFGPPPEGTEHPMELESAQQEAEAFGMDDSEARAAIQTVQTFESATGGAAMVCLEGPRNEPPKEPAILQFFVRSLDGKTIVLRESDARSIGELKGLLLGRVTDESDSVFLSYGGKVLDEGLSLREAGITPGGTLHVRVRFQSTARYFTPSQRATPIVRLLALVRKLKADEERRELWDGILEEMCLFLRPGIDECTFQPLDHAKAFISGGGVNAVASLLLVNDLSFLAFSCVDLVSERIETLPTEHPLRFVALYVGWHLLEAVLTNPLPVESDSDAREHCLLSLSCLVNWRLRGRADEAVWNLLPRYEGENRWEKLRTDICTIWGPTEVEETKEERGAVRALLKMLSDSGVKLFRNLADWMEHLRNHQHRYYADRAPYDKHVRDLFNHLSRALKVLLCPAVDCMLVGKLLPEGLKSMPPAIQVFAAGLEGKLKSPAIESSLSHLSAHLTDCTIAAVEAMVKLAEIDVALEAKLTARFAEQRRALSALMLHRTADFKGMQKLRPLFERPYRHLWAVSLKEPWLRANLPQLRLNPLKVTVQRDQDMLANAFNRIGGADPERLHRGIGVSFRSEEGYGPGVTREFLIKIAEALFNPDFALFRTGPTDRRRVFPNANSGVNSKHLEYFRFSGRIVALAIAHKVMIGVTFCSALLDALWEPSSKSSGAMANGHVAARDIDPELYESCEKLLQMDEDEFNELGLTFVYSRESLGAHQECELIPGGSGIAVGFEERVKFVNLKVRMQLLEPVKEQIGALREGMRDLFTQERYTWQHVYGVLTEQEFAALLQGGASGLSVEDWKDHTTYHGYSENDEVIKRFWDAVQGLTPEQQRNLLYFTTAVRYLPSTGFAGLAERFHIFSTESGVDTLPTSHTCYFQLVLPKYKSLEQMAARLRLVTQGHIAESFGTL